ncbi:Phd_YefM [Roseivivax jejudonensis]|uniref:Phd_YefM n=1 Tax=Roseivivax jejudonensis TaxID=1529041 RepID=A0A1X6ZEA1_9RHOB|nr:type II toxin-antitoxin system prevent-host-death family antitoxin [Roseivivax jejudonensis]SLN48853.1 Phd_YefM [Roseivivax jejudonensis]
MTPDFEEVSISILRDRLAEKVGFVREGGQIYVTHHGRRVAALVPIWHADLYADVEAWTLRDMQRRQHEALKAWETLRRNAGYED